MDGLLLREATESDYEDIVKLSVEAISEVCHSLYPKKETDVWIKAQTRQKYAAYGNHGEFLVLEDSERKIIAVSYAATTTRAEFSGNVDYEIYTLYVSPKFIRKGIGKYLYNEIERRLVIKQAKGIGILSSLYAVPFYKKLGFIQTGTTRSLLTNIKCPIMEKIL